VSIETESSAQASNNNQRRKGGAPKGNKNAQKHGLSVLKRAVNTLGNRMLDKRTRQGKVLAQWREDLIRDLGGDVSIQQDTIVSLATKTMLLLESVDAWLFQQESLINKRKKSSQRAPDIRRRLEPIYGPARAGTPNQAASLSEILSKKEGGNVQARSLSPTWCGLQPDQAGTSMYRLT
jgi:hypothetical protein